MQLTQAWKDLVRAKLKELGQDHRWLEDRIGASRAMVTHMLADAQQSSSLAYAVCEALGIPPPVAVVDGVDEHEALDLFRRLTPRQKRHILATMELLKSEMPD